MSRHEEWNSSDSGEAAADARAGAYLEPDVDKFNQMTPANHNPGLWGDGLEDGNPTAKKLFVILAALCVAVMLVAIVTLFI